MRIPSAIRLCTLLLLGASVGPGKEMDPWANYESAPECDGKIRLRAVWIRSAPAHEILTEGGLTRPSDVKGSTYEFYVLLENIGKEDVELPSSIKGALPTSIGMPIGHIVVVPFVIKFEDHIGRIPLVESSATFRPVRLKPGEAARLPIYYRIVKEGQSLPEHWFFYSVDESIAKRYGWWSGALKCKGEEYRPKPEKG